MQVSAINYGGTVTKISVPDRYGKRENVVLGFDSVAEYQQQTAFLGATVGRVAGRIALGKFTLDGKNYQISQNEGENQLHGGGGFNQKVWQAKTYQTESEAGVIFTTVSPDGEFGYPGNLKVEVTFSLNEFNQWKVHYLGETDQSTLFNPTNHVYFNLTGNPKQSILDHQLMLVSDRFVALQSDLIPTGELLEVSGTAFDFQRPEVLRRGISSQHAQNKLAQGYDHAFVFKANQEQQVKASLVEPMSGRRVQMYTDCPSVVVYSGNQFNGEFELADAPVQQYAGITLETQGLPDAVNQQGFGSIQLNADKKFESETIYQFDVI